MKIDVPFFSNTADDTHCFQACLRMILNHYLPDETFSWKKLDKISGKKNGLWTWPMQGMLYLKQCGFEIINIEDFNYQEFSVRGKEYLINKYGIEVANAQEKYSDIKQEIRNAIIFQKEIKTELRLPSLLDIQNYLTNKYLVLCNVNSKVLSNHSGYVGHFVLIIGYENQSFIIHDPGLPPLKNRSLSFNHLNKAWAYPNDAAKNLLAIRYNTNKETSFP